MHELALTEGIISIIADEKRKNGFERVVEIRLKLGEYSGVIPECIEEFFPIAAKGTAAEGAKLVMERIDAAFTCRECRWHGRPSGSACPDCGAENLKMTAGREFYVDNLKVE